MSHLLDSYTYAAAVWDKGAMGFRRNDRKLLEQGPAATEEAASFGRKIQVLAERYKFWRKDISVGGERTRQSYDAVARFQLESKAGNHDFWDREVKKETVPERPREESSTTALKATAEDRRAQRPS